MREESFLLKNAAIFSVLYGVYVLGLQAQSRIGDWAYTLTCVPICASLASVFIDPARALVSREGDLMLSKYQPWFYYSLWVKRESRARAAIVVCLIYGAGFALLVPALGVYAVRIFECGETNSVIRYPFSNNICAGGTSPLIDAWIFTSALLYMLIFADVAGRFVACAENVQVAQNEPKAASPGNKANAASPGNKANAASLSNEANAASPGDKKTPAFSPRAANFPRAVGFAMAYTAAMVADGIDVGRFIRMRDYPVQTSVRAVVAGARVFLLFTSVVPFLNIDVLVSPKNRKHFWAAMLGTGAIILAEKIGAWALWGLRGRPRVTPGERTEQMLSYAFMDDKLRIVDTTEGIVSLGIIIIDAIYLASVTYAYAIADAEWNDAAAGHDSDSEGETLPGKRERIPSRREESRKPPQGVAQSPPVAVYNFPARTQPARSRIDI